jgi:hypothetical protein
VTNTTKAFDLESNTEISGNVTVVEKGNLQNLPIER